MCKCHSIHKLVVGALLLLNAFIWPRWLGIDGWVSFVAVLMLLGGFLHLVMPQCKGCCTMPAKATSAAPVKKRRR